MACKKNYYDEKYDILDKLKNIENNLSKKVCKKGK